MVLILCTFRPQTKTQYATVLYMCGSLSRYIIVLEFPVVFTTANYNGKKCFLKDYNNDESGRNTAAKIFLPSFNVITSSQEVINMFRFIISYIDIIIKTIKCVVNMSIVQILITSSNYIFLIKMSYNIIKYQIIINMVRCWKVFLFII